MTPAEIAQGLDAVLLDVRLADDYKAAHLEDARNNAVFEVAFNERIAEILPDKNSPVIVYGWNAESKEAEMAAEKLDRLGYPKVSILEGGFDAAAEVGVPLTKGAPLPVGPPAPDGTLPVDRAESRVGWTGRNLLNRHWGEVAIKSGTLSFDGGQLTGGVIALDLRELTCTDLAGTPQHDVLIAHLHNDDFFDVENHPEGRLEIVTAEHLPGATAGAPNLAIVANLTLRGITQEISFTATSGITPGGKAAAQANFSIDRTRWGVLYGSGKFFHRLAGHLVNDLIDFEVKIVTT